MVHRLLLWNLFSQEDTLILHTFGVVTAKAPEILGQLGNSGIFATFNFYAWRHELLWQIAGTQ